MSDSKQKKGLNIKLLLFTLIVAFGVVTPIVMKVKSTKSDLIVTKQKITRADLDGFRQKVADMVKSYTVRHEGETPIVHPPAGSDLYLLAKNYDWGKFILELEQGKPYKLHLATLDMRHAIVVRELGLMNRIKVGEFKTIEFAPKKAGRFDIVCGEFCGAGHANMIGKIYVVESVAGSDDGKHEANNAPA